MNNFTFNQILENFPHAVRAGRVAYAPYRSGDDIRVATYRADKAGDPALVSDERLRDVPENVWNQVRSKYHLI